MRTVIVHQGQTLDVAVPGVLGNDSDADGDPLTAEVVSSPANGFLRLNSDGSFDYTPNGGFSGDDTFSYKDYDGALYSNTVTVTITVGQGVTISGVVWQDTDQNGIREANEALLPNLLVKLLDQNGNTVDSVYTNSSGQYQFLVTPGTYAVQFVLPQDYAFSPEHQGSDDTIDSDADLTTGKTAYFTLLAGESEDYLDGGMYSTV